MDLSSHRKVTPGIRSDWRHQPTFLLCIVLLAQLRPPDLQTWQLCLQALPHFRLWERIKRAWNQQLRDLLLSGFCYWFHSDHRWDSCLIALKPSSQIIVLYLHCSHTAMLYKLPSTTTSSQKAEFLFPNFDHHHQVSFTIVPQLSWYSPEYLWYDVLRMALVVPPHPRLP